MSRGGDGQTANNATQAVGFRRGNRRIIAVSFDDNTFDAVCDYAKADGLSFAEAVRQLVEFGLEDVGADE